MSTFVIEYGLDELDSAAKQCAELLKDIAVVTFTGSLGAGKTTLVSAILKQWGVLDPVVSPTFTYINSYGLGDKGKIYHFDLYRLDSLNDFMQAGFHEYLYADKGACFIEWPEIIHPLLDKRVAHISIDFIGLDKRKLVCDIKR